MLKLKLTHYLSHSQVKIDFALLWNHKEGLIQPANILALCDPCANPFDFVAKFETLSEDANWLLIRANSDLKFPIVLEGNVSSNQISSL